MNRLEAYTLLDAVESALGANTARVHQLGNAEHVVRIRKGDYFLWDDADWFTYCQAQGIRQVRHGGQSWHDQDYLSGIDCTQAYVLQIA